MSSFKKCAAKLRRVEFLYLLFFFHPVSMPHLNLPHQPANCYAVKKERGKKKKIQITDTFGLRAFKVSVSYFVVLKLSLPRLYKSSKSQDMSSRLDKTSLHRILTRITRAFTYTYVYPTYICGLYIPCAKGVP